MTDAYDEIEPALTAEELISDGEAILDSLKRRKASDLAINPSEVVEETAATQRWLGGLRHALYQTPDEHFVVWPELFAGVVRTAGEPTDEHPEDFTVRPLTIGDVRDGLTEWIGMLQRSS